MGNLKYKNYIGSVEYNETDKILYGKVQGVRGLISYEGQNVDELEHDFRAAVDEYLETCREKGIEPQKSFTGAFNVRIPAEIHALAVLTAIGEGSTLNAFVRSAIEEKLNMSDTRLRKIKRGRQTAN